MSRAAPVEERQLRPIYEALDTGNVKSALTQTNKLLKKYPPTTPQKATRQLLTALKILALTRANKLDEANPLVTSLLAEVPIDEGVLTTLAHSLKPLDRTKELVGMWVDAWGVETKAAEELKKKLKSSRDPKLESELATKIQHAEELGAQAFMAMVRSGYWAQAQQTSFKLYRAKSADGKGIETEGVAIRYLFWSAVSAVMQSVYPTPPPPVPVLVMIPPPEAVREWEEAKKKELEEDKRLLEQAGLPLDTTHDISPSRRKKRAFALQLAKRLIDMTIDKRGLANSKYMNPDRFWLYIDILKRASDAAVDDEASGLFSPSGKTTPEHYQPISEIFHDKMAVKLTNASLHIEELRGEVARLSADWKRECEGMGERLDKGDRNWKSFTTFFDALFHFLPTSSSCDLDPQSYPQHIAREPPKSDDGKKDGEPTSSELQTNGDEKQVPELPAIASQTPFTLSYTREFLDSLAKKDETQGSGNERGVYLGVIEFEKRLRKVPEIYSPNDAPDYVGLLEKYFNMFGNKPVVVEDLVPYALELEGEERVRWDAFVGGIEMNVEDVNSLQRTINVLKFQRLLAEGSPVSSDSEKEFAKKCTKLYHSALPLGKGLSETDLHPADDLAVLAATALIHAHHLMLQNASSESAPCAEGEEEKLSIHAPLLDALVLLEQACLTSRWAYAPRFLLVRLYRLLAAPQLAHQHYSMSNLKSIQFDTLSHHVLSRASTFSLSSIGDLTLVNECVESSQIYTVSGVDASDQLVKAFQWERYNQIAEFVLLEEKVDNSLQRDLTKLEHFRMKNLHEGLTPETVEVELVELRFVWGRVHHDNRDFDLLPSYQARGAASIDEMTSVGGKRLSKQWFDTMLKIWILILHQASEQLWTEEEQKAVLPSISQFTEEELSELTQAERLWLSYSRALLIWLAPHHAPLKHAIMTNAVSVLAAAKAKQTSSSNPGASNTPAVKAKSNTGRKANGLSNGTEGTAGAAAGEGIGVKVGDVKVITGMLTLHEPMEVPPVPSDLGEPTKEPPQELNDLLDSFQTLFDDTIARPSLLPWEHLHVAQLAHEVAFVTHLLTARFALAGGKKKAHPTYKPLRAKALTLVEHVSKGTTRLAEESEFNADARKSWLQGRKSGGVLDEYTDEQVILVARGLFDNRKRMYEGLAKGLTKATQGIAKAAAGVPAGTA